MDGVNNMDSVVLLETLKKETALLVKDLVMPVRMQKGDKEQLHRVADVYKMRLPDSTAATKKAPYILHQVITTSTEQPSGKRVESKVVVRSIFCVYNDDEQEGSLMLLNLMERVRIGLLKKCTIGKMFALDLRQPLEQLVYNEDTAPYYAGEMITTWTIPAVNRTEEIRQWR